MNLQPIVAPAGYYSPLDGHAVQILSSHRIVISAAENKWTREQCV